MRNHLKTVAILAGLLPMIGCGDREAQVVGRVTCQGKPVAGTILFSPVGDGQTNTGPAASAPLDDDGRFQLSLRTLGKHTVVVTPRDVKFPVPPGEFDYPCDRSAQEREIAVGTNDIAVDLPPRR